jgi:hypothetical protein
MGHKGGRHEGPCITSGTVAITGSYGSNGSGSTQAAAFDLTTTFRKCADPQSTLYARGKKLWIRFRDAGGKWRDASTHYEVGQEALAQATHDEVVARVGALGRTVKHAPARSVTVRVFAADWIAKRRERDLDWKNDESRLKHHVLADLGELVLADVRARHVVDLFHKLRTDRERNLAQRTIYNIYTVVSAMFRDAKLADLIEQTPCILDERQLGPLVQSLQVPETATENLAPLGVQPRAQMRSTLLRLWNPAHFR